jgi:hypothetical protein
MARNVKKPGRHKTIHPDLQRVIEWIRGVPEVDRIIVGRSRGGRHGSVPGTIKAQSIELTGVNLIGFSDQGASEFFVVSSHPEVVKAKINEKFSPNE